MQHDLKSEAMVIKTDGVRPDVAAIIADVLHYKGPLNIEMQREEIPRWDSLRHVALVVAIESTFGISLSMDEMQEIVSIRDLQRVLERHGK